MGRPPSPLPPLVVALALAAGSARAAGGATPAPEPTAPPARGAMVADVARVEPGGTARIGVLIRMDPGWHVYWVNPGDAGLPTRLELTLPAGATAGALAWPLPHRYEEPGGIVAFGYSDAVLLARPVAVPPDARPGSRIEVGIEARWLVCRERCLEGGYQGRAYLPVGPRREVNREAFARFGGPLPGTPVPGAGPFTVEAAPAGSGERAVTLAWREPPGAVEVFPYPGDEYEVRVEALEQAGARTTLRLAIESYGATPGEVPVLVVSQDPQGRRQGFVLGIPPPDRVR